MKTCGCLLVLLLCASPASAQVWNVNSTRDVVDAIVGDRICDTGGPAMPDGLPECTLRAAMQEANADRRFYHRIHVPAGTYVLTLRHLPSSLEEDIGQGTLAWPIGRSVAVGDLDIDVGMEITGDGEGVTVIDGGDIDRVFAIWPAPSEVGFQFLTIRNGTSQRQGGCLWNQSRTILGMRSVTVEDCLADQQVGGGIFNNGHALFERVTIRNNVALRGGGMETSDFLRMNESTISGNTALPSGGREGGGGGLSNVSNYRRPSVSLTNSVVWGNQAEYGGGILNHGSMGISHSTLSGNRSRQVNGGSAVSSRHRLSATAAHESLGIGFSTIAYNMGVALEFAADRFSIGNSILAGNVGRFGVGENCTTGVANSENTFEDGRFCLLIGPGDRFDVDPMLAPLADNGGPTLTHALLEGSPAIDATTAYGPRDQRGVLRPVGAASDLGAYEFGMDPFELIVLIPIDWSMIFAGGMFDRAVDYSLMFNLQTLGKPAAAPRVVGVKPAEGQAEIKYQLSLDGSAIHLGGVAVPPKKGSTDMSPPLFYLLVQQGIGTPGKLSVSSAECKCEAQPRKSQAPIMVPAYKPAGK